MEDCSEVTAAQGTERSDRYVFISYSSKDSQVAADVCRHIERAGFRCWIAPRNVHPGENYPSQIVEAIRGCSAFVLLASTHTNVSGHVSNEVALAFDGKKIIIPFRIEEMTFSDEYLYFLGRKHWIDAYPNVSAGFAKLTETLTDVLKEGHAGTPAAASRDREIAAHSAEIALPAEAARAEVADENVRRTYSRAEIVGIIRQKSQKFPYNLLEKLSDAAQSMQFREYALKMFALTAKVYYGNRMVEQPSDLVAAISEELIRRPYACVQVRGLPGGAKNMLLQLVFYDMLDKLQAVANRYEELCAKAEQPDFYADPARAAKLLKEKNDIEPIVEAYHALCRAKQEQAEAKELLTGETDPEMRALCQEQFQQAKGDQVRLEEELKILLLPKDPNDEKNVIVEIRGGVGGEESALFAHSLYRMYTMYAAARGWSVELLNYNETELGGVKEADFLMSGRGAWSRMKYESGVHRVQRVPETESGGRVHTSTATVAVLPEMEPVDVEIRDEDIEMQVFRSSGAGGQHINKTSSAVRLIHKPTGIVVACQEERSQVQNREKCMRMLASKLYEIEQARVTGEITGLRRSQVGTGMRNERIRTYNFPQGRVTDHRIGLTLYKIDAVMNGDLDELIDALATADQAEKLKNAQ